MRSIFRDEIKNEIRFLEKAWIADIQSGAGILWDNLTIGESNRLVFVDIKPVTSKKNKTYVQANCHTRLPFRSNTFSTILSTEGIEHIVTPLHFISELFRVLKPGGKLLISTPNIASLSSRLQFFLRGKYSGCTPIAKTPEDFSTFKEYERFLFGEHVSPLSYAQLSFFLTRSGFHVSSQKGLAIKNHHYFLIPFVFLIKAINFLGYKRLLPEQARLRKIMTRTDMLLGKHIWLSAIKPNSPSL